MWINNRKKEGIFIREILEGYILFLKKRNFGLVRMSFGIIDRLFENSKYVDDWLDILFIFCAYI